MITSENQKSKHEVFAKLEHFSAFYGALAGAVIGVLSPGVRGPICGADTYVFSGIKGTLDSIEQILSAGRINDAYVLLRKYHDSVVINVYSNLYLEDHFSIANFVVQKIDDWVQGKDKLPRFQKMMEYIKASRKLAPISKLLFQQGDRRYSELRTRCNNQTHYNFFQTLQLNDPQVYVKERPVVLDEFSKDLEHIFILHISYLFYLVPAYMRSSDYIDSLEVGMQPEKGSEYFVAPFVQEIFDSILRKHRADLAEVIKRDTPMALE